MTGRVLVGCEFSGIVRDAFRARGYDAVSCDLEPSERPGPHIRGDVRNSLTMGWSLGIFHPPCTYLSSSGARWWERPGARTNQRRALDFFEDLLNAPIPMIAVENPIGKPSTAIRKPDQIVQPWQFGEPTTKATCFWLKGGLPLLRPTNIVRPTRHDVWRMPPSADRQKNRSRTYEGMAAAMAEQWGPLLQEPIPA